MKIGIDLDDVIADFFPGFLDFYNKKYKKNFSIKDMASYWIWKIGIGKNKQEAIRLVDEFHDSSEFDSLPLVSGARESIFELSQMPDSRLYIITSRPLEYRLKTNKFIDKHFQDISLTIYYSGDFHNGINQSEYTKAKLCKRLQLDYFVEDCLDYAEACAEKSSKVFLLDKPWNQGSNKKVERVYNWQEILEKIKGDKNAICS